MKKVDTIERKQKPEEISAPLVSKEKKNNIKEKPKQKKGKEKGKKKIGLKVKKYLSLFVIALFSLLFLVLLSFSGAVYAYENNTGGEIIYGTNLLGNDLGGLGRAEAGKVISDRLGDVTFTFVVDDEEVNVTPEELGLEFSGYSILGEALERRADEGFLGRYLSGAVTILGQIDGELGEYAGNLYRARYNHNLEIKYSLEEEKMAKFVEGLAAKYKVEEKNASLVMNGTDVQVIPAIYGRQLVTNAVRTQLESALASGETEKIHIYSEEVNPDILEEDTKASITAAQKLISLPVKYTYEEKSYVPDKATIGNWVVFAEEGGKLVPKIKESKVRAYIDSIAKKDINITPVNEKVKIVNGKERTVLREGKNGLAVNSSLLAENTAANLNAKKGIASKIPTYTVKYKTEVNNVLVANWAKYIEIDISSQRMCAYLKGGEKVNCWAVTTGANGWNTPTGTFLIRRKAGAGGQPGAYGGGVCMPNPPSTTPLCGINWVSTFTAQGHAIHEAWWRSSFGGSDYVWNGSHGCINATYNIAKFIYNWAPIGTPVVIHW
ncbi:MAG: peptidoglycan binding domain-containing protein [Patescibacteria group bacterium]|nr:peptidoglycan binding domain-containing protein [Patescibacteria group bacterium]